MGVDLFVGGHAATIQGEREDLSGRRMFSAAHRVNKTAIEGIENLIGIIDSGAFTDPWASRLTSEQALTRQLAWETEAGQRWGYPWQAYALVSYDLLIDEVWAGGEKIKRRWSIKDAEKAVKETVAAAQYLASQRENLSPRRLILSAQGVDAIQYRECMAEVLSVATPADIIGFGGWCILGRMTSWLPEFWRTLRLTFPMIAGAGIKDVHIFGVLYQPALGGMLWLADQYGLSISTDSTAPIKACMVTTDRARKKAGVRVESGYWRDNANWWIESLANLRQSEYYKAPPILDPCRQLDLFQEAA